MHRVLVLRPMWNISIDWFSDCVVGEFQATISFSSSYKYKVWKMYLKYKLTNVIWSSQWNSISDRNYSCLFTRLFFSHFLFLLFFTTSLFLRAFAIEMFHVHTFRAEKFCHVFQSFLGFLVYKCERLWSIGKTRSSPNQKRRNLKFSSWSHIEHSKAKKKMHTHLYLPRLSRVSNDCVRASGR